MAGLDLEQLYRLLRARPDTAVEPAPRTLAEVAERLVRPGSAGVVLRRLPVPCLQTAEALVALGPRAGRHELARLLDATGGERAAGLDTALQALAGQGLAWPDEHDRLHPNPALRQIWPSPLGLEAPVAELLAEATSEELRSILLLLDQRVPVTKQQRLATLTDHFADPRRLDAVLADAPAGVRPLLLEHAETARAVFSPSGEVGRAARWARERGLLVRAHHGYGPARVPAEVTLALRGPSWHAPFDPVPPEPELVPVGAAEVAREAVSAATAFTTQAAAVLAECALHPVALLKSGGVGPRELGRLAKTTRCSETLLRLVLECALAAGLLVGAGGGPPTGNRTAHLPRTTRRAADLEAEDGPLALTPQYDSWREEDPARQFVALAAGWLTLPFTPTAVLDKDGKSWPALVTRAPSPSCRHARRGLLTAAGRLPAERGAARAAGLGRLVAWHRPLCDQLPQEPAPFATVIQEAELLGVVARGTLSPLGAALAGHSAEQPQGLLDCARRLLPGATERARLGTDLTAVVAGPPGGRLTALLDAAADRESHGTASVWRFTAGSIRRALDGGRSPQQLTAELLAVGGVEQLPQPLSYLIGDTARRHGRVRVVAPGSVLYGEDPALLAELLAHRRLASLRLRLIAPTVLVSATGPEATLAALRAEGYAPVEEGADGTLLLERAGTERAPAVPPQRSGPVRSPRTGRALPSSADLRELAGRLFTVPGGPAAAYGKPDELTEEELARETPRLMGSCVSRLARAIRADQPITIEYLAGAGEVVEYDVCDLALDPPFLHARRLGSEDRLALSLASLYTVLPIDRF
ncbi:helicase-associated domain-containing protein [Kitasatospora azatica]|uniref:helicase-associated domain-containing protein n=1 Tax=Kitasatospora azatica TaxID=58347 RepID=UPI00068EA845|nr:helicase-associated domain-containing protein [Kitasatospora azatica]